ncbi:MAG TPA: hypothetical protein VFR37_19500 [Longimicrobium sp.]|nr:hypothetical protein [Longimicrobium sp.]
MSFSVYSPRRSPTQKLLLEETLPLTAVAELVPAELRRRADASDPFAPVPAHWGSYYQSLGTKAASTQDGLFRFDTNGAYAPERPGAARDSLCAWLGLTSRRDRRAIGRWLDSGTALDEGLFRRLRHRLEDEMLAEADLYDRPICRLVQVDQLRYDPDYTAVYQLTPAQVRLIDEQREQADAWAAGDGSEPSVLARIRENQRMYWMISERFQSSIALFDSDLGRNERVEEGTKNLLLIHDRTGAEGGTIAPYELNQYSPLRFWSPPPTFARYVFHMLFWQPLVTGEDLYGRPFPKGIGESVARFRVAFNVYNSSKYRIADYGKLLRLVEALTGVIGSRGRGRPATKLAGLADVELDHTFFYPREFAHNPLVQLPVGRVRLPLRSLGEERWELASRYQRPGEPTTVGHMLKMLRDRALEIVLWSRYQMEIRSVGMVPVQRVYRAELEPDGVAFVERLRALYAEERYAELDEAFSAAVFSGQLGRWVRLRKEYDREYSRVLDPNSAIRRLNTRNRRERDDAKPE